MNPLIFMASIIVSLVGVISDNLTTRKMIKDIGKESESNTCFIKICERYGYKTWIVIEALFVGLFGIGDFFLTTISPTNILFFGVLYGVFRGLATAHNFQIIGQYRTIGIDAFKEHNEWLSQLFKRATPNNRCKMRLQYFACSFICIFASTLMLFIPAFESSFQADLFLTFFVAGLVFGIGGFLFGIGIAN